jgi:hypothetical protein
MNGYRNHETYLAIITITNELSALLQARRRLEKNAEWEEETFRDLIFEVDPTFWPDLSLVDWPQVARAVLEE